MNIAPHPFATLLENRTAAENWLAAFCARRREIRAPEGGPSFPALVAGQTPDDWLATQFELLDDKLRNELRKAIVSLIEGRGGRLDEQAARDQVIGTLLSVASQLKFSEIGGVLRQWVRSDWLHERHTFRLGGENVPLRREVWSMLIGWGKLDSLDSQMTRDLVSMAKSGESGTAQICYVALGTHRRDEAIRVIPHFVKLPTSYWMSAVDRFFKSVGPMGLLDQSLRPAWSECIGPCFFNRSLERYMRDLRAAPYEYDSSREDRLRHLLQSIGIRTRTRLASAERTEVHLSYEERNKLVVDVSAYTRPIDHSASGPGEQSQEVRAMENAA